MASDHKELEQLQSELLRSLKSWNPFERMNVEFLKESIAIIKEEETRQREEEKRQREEEKRQREEEKRQKDERMFEETRKREEEKRQRDEKMFEETRQREEEKRQREEEKRQKDERMFEETRKREEEKRQREEEMKVISLMYSEVTGQEPTEITRHIFDTYYRFSDKRIIGYNELHPSKYCKIQNFDDLKESEVYYVEYINSEQNFGGYSKIEGNIQTHDCVRSILSGEVNIPPFSCSNDTNIYYEFNIIPPSTASANFQNLTFRFPIRPDALLVNGNSWLLIESKHACKIKDEINFFEKVNFIRKHIGEKWVTKELSTPLHILAAVCSVDQFTESDMSPPSLLRIVRSFQGYELVLERL